MNNIEKMEDWKSEYYEHLDDFSNARAWIGFL